MDAVSTLNKASSIKEVVDLILRYKNHSKRALFSVTNLGGQSLIIWHTWLHKHYPEIDWITGKVKMSCCQGSYYSGCHNKFQAE